MTAPQALGFKAFAQLLGCSPGYVTGLRKAGRLVLSENGKQVLVEASRRRIEDTRDPAKQAVANRHAVARGAPLAAGQGGGAALPSDSPQGGGEDASDDVPLPADSDLSMRRARAQTEREEALAIKARRENLVEQGMLLDAAEVEAAIADAGTTLRNRLETLADVLAPQVASVPDEARCRAIIADQVEHLLAELARQFAGAVSKSEAA